MRRAAIAAVLAVALVALPTSGAQGRSCPTHPLYAAQTHARQMFAGSSAIPKSEWRTQNRLVSCQSSRANVKRIRGYQHRLHLAHAARRSAALNPFHAGVASYYNDAALGLGTHYGFAACGYGLCVPRGTRVEFCRSGCVVAVRDDSGPYISGRDWDVNEEVAQAIGLTSVGVGTVQWRIVH